MAEQNRDRKRAAMQEQNRDHQRAAMQEQNRDRDKSGGVGPLAYLITFRTYGTWLHGDERGSVDRDHNVPGTPLLDPDPQREREERGRSRQAAVAFDERCRQTVQRTILDVCEHRGWSVHELNVRSNHVHIVVSAAEPPEQVMRSLKSSTTRRLKESGLIPAGVKPWSRHGSTGYLWKPHQIEAACRYVLDAQGPDL